jgi:hypothetical protein
MSFVGQVESLWRYPVKSMRGEELEERPSLGFQVCMATASLLSRVPLHPRDSLT